MVTDKLKAPPATRTDTQKMMAMHLLVAEAVSKVWIEDVYHLQSDEAKALAQEMCESVFARIAQFAAAIDRFDTGSKCQCKNCGSTERLDVLRSRGHLSCCPEREMIPNSVAELNANFEKKPDALR